MDKGIQLSIATLEAAENIFTQLRECTIKQCTQIIKNIKYHTNTSCITSAMHDLDATRMRLYYIISDINQSINSLTDDNYIDDKYIYIMERNYWKHI